MTRTPPHGDLTPATRICVLHGPEPMLQRERFGALQQALEKAHGRVQTQLFDGRTAPLADVLDEVRSFGLMADHKLVVVDEAEVFVTAHRQALERYASAPVDHATLVLRAQRWHRGKLDKLIEQVGCVCECKPLGAPQAAHWLTRRATGAYHRTLAPATAKRLVERLGCDLMKLDNELAKLAVWGRDGDTIDPDLVDKLIGHDSDEPAWAIQDAVLTALLQAAEADHRRAGGGPEPAPPAGLAIRKIHELVELSGQADVLVSYWVADIVRKLCLGYQLKRQGMPRGQIAKRLKLWGPRQSAAMAVLDRLDPHLFGTLFDRVVTLDQRAKTGLGTPVRNMTCFVAQTTQALRPPPSWAPPSRSQPPETPARPKSSGSLF